MGLRKQILIWVLLVGIAASAQKELDSTVASDAYIRRFPEKITLRAGMINTGNSFIVTDRETSTSLRLNPGTSNYFGMSVLFRSLEIDYGFSPGFLNKEDREADPKLFNLNFRMFLGQWMQTINLYKQDGFYTEIDGVKGYLPDFSTLKLGGRTSYIFNRNFSFRAVGFQNEWQKKSAGSFIPSAQFYYTRYSLRDGGEERLENSWDIAVGPGYYYNWVLGGHLILGMGNTTGAGIRYVDSKESQYGSFVLNTRFLGALGYNSERIFAGVNFRYNLLEQWDKENIRLDDSIHFFEIYVGYRFDAPEGWVRTANRFNRKFGID